jgi:hypothetical protein
MELQAVGGPLRVNPEFDNPGEGGAGGQNEGEGFLRTRQPPRLAPVARRLDN